MFNLSKTKLIIDIIRCDSKQELEKELNNSCDAECICSLPPWVMNFLYFEVKENNAKIDIPEEVFEIIKKSYLYNHVHNEIKLGKITELSQEFNKNDIDYVFLKGASQIITTYKDFMGLRPMADIDLLVRKKDRLRSEDALRNLGYKTEDEEEWRLWSLKKHFHLTYSKNITFLELHWDILWPVDLYRFNNYIALKKMFEMTEEIIIGKNKIKILKPAGNIFVLCINLSRDLYDQDKEIRRNHNKKDKGSYARDLQGEAIFSILKFFRELKMMIRYYGKKINWDDLFFLSRSMKKEYEVFTLLFLAKKVAKVDIPEFVLFRIKRNIFTFLYINMNKKIKYHDIAKSIRIYLIFCQLVNMQLLILNPLLLARNFYLKIYEFYILHLHPDRRHLFVKKLMRHIRRGGFYFSR